MNIRIDPHTRDRVLERGASEDEIRQVIESGQNIGAKHGRQGKFKIFDFKQNRHGRYYEQKRIEVIYVDEGDAIITVTVYVFYGNWQE